jgi:hypothetical protein
VHDLGHSGTGGGGQDGVKGPAIDAGGSGLVSRHCPPPVGGLPGQVQDGLRPFHGDLELLGRFGAGAGQVDDPPVELGVVPGRWHHVDPDDTVDIVALGQESRDSLA